MDKETKFPRRIVTYSLFWGPNTGIGFEGRRHQLHEYAYGLWKSIMVASTHGWGVCVYHDGSVESVLRRFRFAFPPCVLRCVRVDIPKWLRGRRYLGCLWRMLAADDPRVDVWLSRDLDDPLDPTGLKMVTKRWVEGAPESDMHIQAEPYSTPERTQMINLGWFGQRNNWRHRPVSSLRATLIAYLRNTPVLKADRYTADEEFLTDVWVPLMCSRKHSGRVIPLPSHPYRRAGPTPKRRCAAWRRFLRLKVDARLADKVATNDDVIDLRGYKKR